MLEIWVDIKDYKDYQISNHGRLKSFKKSKKGNILTESKNTFGYVQYELSGDKKLAHRLVAEAFIPNVENKPFVNHINGLKSDNRVGNLEWVTAKENINHSFNIGLQSRTGEKNGNTKLTEDRVYLIKWLAKHNTKLLQKEIAYIFDTNEGIVSSIRNNRTWKHVEV